MEEALTALLQPIAGGRRHWGRAPDSTLKPHVVLFKIDDVPNYTYQGRTNLMQARVQANCYADTFTQARDVAKQITDLLGGHKGGIFQAIFVENGGRNLAVEDAGSVNAMHAVAVDLMVHYTEGE